MRACLLQPASKAGPQTRAPAPQTTVLDLERDLWLQTLYRAMAEGEELIAATAREEILSGTDDIGIISYRQKVLADCLKNPSLARQLYALIGEALREERQADSRFSRLSPSALLDTAIGTLAPLLDGIDRMRELLRAQAGSFVSSGFAALAQGMDEELGEEYTEGARSLLRELRFPEGLLIGAELGIGCKGRGYRAIEPGVESASLRYRLPEGEDARRAVEELRDRGLARAAEALARSRDRVRGFLAETRRELAFYLGCVNLAKRLEALGMGLCWPEPVAAGEGACRAAGLYDPCLALELGAKVVPSALEADGRGLVLVTGANQGGKSTFLRSVGLAQVLMQCGMFVPARSFRSSVCAGVFTHFRKAEDRSMRSGKLDEELGRIGDIVDRARPSSMLLLNESFASTNEREGSEIGRRIVGALLEAGLRIFFVTHLYDFAASYLGSPGSALFLLARREEGGRRSYEIAPGEPLDTSFGRDVYDEVFGPG
jgi:hypothetical protein